MMPQTKYAKSGSLSIAYQVFGNGPTDLVIVPGWVSNIDIFWEQPEIARFFERLGTFCRVILFDKRGTGLSERVSTPSTLEERIDDVSAVLDAVGSQKVALLGYSEGGPMCALFAATYPARVVALIMIGSFSRIMAADDYPEGFTTQQGADFLKSIELGWGGPVGFGARFTSRKNDERLRSWWAKFLRSGASSAMALALTRAAQEIDIRHLLGSIQMPTLLIHSTRDHTVSVKASRYMQQRILGSKLLELNSDDHMGFMFDDANPVLDAIEEFLTGKRAQVAEDRVIATIMFTDIVGSTALASELGDRRWRDLLDNHHSLVRRELGIYRGREISTAGDGFYASFDGPARAITCGNKLVSEVNSIGLKIRVGIHTGECDVQAGQMVGLAIHIGARVAAAAPPDAVLVSQTVKDLVAGSGIEFESFGVHELKGVPDPRQLFLVRKVPVRR